MLQEITGMPAEVFEGKYRLLIFCYLSMSFAASTFDFSVIIFQWLSD